MAQSGLILRLLWLVSFLAVLVAYTGAATGAVALPPRVPSLPDLLAPLLIAITEFLMFGVLARQAPGLDTGGAIIAAWYFAYSTFALFAAMSVWRAKYLTQTADYESGLKNVIRAYTTRLRRDAILATTGSISGIAGGILHLKLNVVAQPLDFGLIAFITFGIIGGLSSHTVTSKQFRQALRRT